MNYGHLSIKKTLSEEDVKNRYGKTWIWTAFDPCSRLDYAVVHKTREKGRVVKVEQKVVFGDAERIEKKRKEKKRKCGQGRKINTAYIERSNGTLRKMDSHLRRKSLTFAKQIDYFEAKMNLIVFIYNFIRPHTTLSKNAENYKPAFPCSESGIINRNWTLEDAYRI